MDPSTSNAASALESLKSLNDRYAIKGFSEIIDGNGNLPKIRITTPAASAEIYLHGAHLTSWHPSGADEVIFLSSQAQWMEGRAIRGGVPVCFPWFNAKADDPKAPSHGFVRTKVWELESIVHDGDLVVVSLFTESSEATRHWWPHDFRLVHRITVGAELKMELIMTNTGIGALEFQEALHTYYHVGDVQQTTLSGLDGVSFLDNTDSNREKLQQGDISFTRKIDNAYLNTAHELHITDQSLRRQISIVKENSQNTVVWNPWEEGAHALSDLGDSEWQQMLCCEVANIRASAVKLEAGAQHTMTAIVRVKAL